MPLLIDTYNVLHVTGVLPPDLAGIGLGGLIELIRGSRFRADVAYLVCDGRPADAPPPLGDGRVRVRYAGPGRDADAIIARMVAQSTAPRRLVVVSSDRAVLRNARRRRCRTLSSDRFLARLVHDAEQAGRGGSGPFRIDGMPGAEAWMREFDLDPGHHTYAAAAPDAPSDHAPADPELPAAVIGEAEAMEADWRAALEEAERSTPPMDARPVTLPRSPEPLIAAAPAPSPPRDVADDDAIIPPSVIAEAEELLRREVGGDTPPA